MAHSVSGFRSENWSEADREQRLAELQALEDDMAEQQGREARTVRTDRDLPVEQQCDGYGYYWSAEPEYITIDEDSLDNPMECMDTVIHEGRHAYQDDVVNDRIENDVPESTKESWAQNNECYQACGEKDVAFCDYYFQPIEADTNQYAKEMMDSYYDELGDDEAYSQYQSDSHREFYQAHFEAQETYGENYMQAIDNKVKTEYQAEHTSQEQASERNEEQSQAQASDKADGISY